jgi:hypothetical protein
VVVYAYNLRIWEVEARRSQDQPGIHSEFRIGPSYIVRPCLKKQTDRQNCEEKRYEEDIVLVRVYITQV